MAFSLSLTPFSTASELSTSTNSFDSVVTSAVDIERNFMLVRKILRKLGLKVRIDHVNKALGTPSPYNFPCECSISLDNFLPDHMSVKVRKETKEAALELAKFEFCKCMESNCLISLPMFEAWTTIYSLYDKYPHLYSRLADQAQKNYRNILKAIPHHINPAYPNNNLRKELNKILDTVYEETAFSHEPLRTYLYDLPNLGPYLPKFRNEFGLIPNYGHYHSTMFRLRASRALFPDDFAKYEREIEVYIRARELKDSEKTLKKNCFHVLEESIRHMPKFGAGKLYLVGSTATDTATSGSDLDIHFSLDDQHGRSPFLLQLAPHLDKLQNVLSIIPIYEAVVPILQIAMVAPYDAIKVEISTASPYSVYTTFLISHYMKMDPRARKLAILIKQWATNYGIRNPVNGTMSGISLLIMVIHFLQCAIEPPVLPNLQFLRPDLFNDKIPMSELKEVAVLNFANKENLPPNDATMGELFVAFFEYYHHFDFDQNGISLYEGGIISRDHLDIHFDRRGMFIAEPYAYFNTLRSLSDFNLVHESIKEAYHLLNGPELESGPPNFRRLMYNHASL